MPLLGQHPHLPMQQRTAQRQIRQLAQSTNGCACSCKNTSWQGRGSSHQSATSKLMLKSCINQDELPAAAMVQKASFEADIDAATASSDFKAATAQPPEAQQTRSGYPLLKDRGAENARLARPWAPDGGSSGVLDFPGPWPRLHLS